MFNQTIALFRYQLLGILNRKLLVVLIAIAMAAFLFSRFVAELAIIHSQSISLASLAELLRYSLLLMLVISICHQISQDYELGQFERLLATPDWEVYTWLVGQKPVPGNYESPLLNQMMAYRYQVHAG